MNYSDSGYLPPSFTPPNSDTSLPSPFSRTLFNLASSQNQASPPAAPPSSTSSTESETSTEFNLELEKQWKESMKTLESILFSVLLPYGVRMYGKKFTEFVYIRYLCLGGMDTTEFWVGGRISRWLLRKGIGFTRDSSGGR